MHRCCMPPSATDCASSSEIERPQIRPVAYTATMTFLQEGQKATVLQLPAAEKPLVSSTENKNAPISASSGQLVDLANIAMT